MVGELREHPCTAVVPDDEHKEPEQGWQTGLDMAAPSASVWTGSRVCQSELGSSTH